MPDRTRLRLDWRGRLLLPHRVAAAAADMLRGHAVVADAASEVTGDGRWRALAARLRDAATRVQAVGGDRQEDEPGHEPK